MITRRARLWLSRGIATTLIAVFAVLAGSTWLYSSRIEAQLLTMIPPQGRRDLVVVATDSATVTLPLDDRTARPGRWGLEYEGGYAELGEVVSTGAGVVTREITAMTGSVSAGTAVAFDRMAFAGDPAARGVPHQEVLVPGPLGDYPAWLVGGDDDTWVVFVHDRGADRREALRILPTVASLGFPVLVMTYRNDVDAPASGGGRGGIGDEWPDLDAAVGYALDAGAGDVVLVGYGVGGSIVELFMRESRRSGRVAGIVLDAPLLDGEELVARAAEAQHVPGFIVAWSKAVATLRFGIDWEHLSHLAHAGAAPVPTLILHGVQDPLYPVEVSGQFAAAAPRTVRLVAIEGAGHGEAWNLDPAAYENEVDRFLREVALAGPSPGGED